MSGGHIAFWSLGATVSGEIAISASSIMDLSLIVENQCNMTAIRRIPHCLIHTLSHQNQASNNGGLHS